MTRGVHNVADAQECCACPVHCPPPHDCEACLEVRMYPKRPGRPRKWCPVHALTAIRDNHREWTRRRKEVPRGDRDRA